MLQRLPFSEQDTTVMKQSPKTFWLTFYMFLIFQIPFSFLIGLVGLTKKGFGYWPTTIAFILFFVLVSLLILIKSFWNYRKDMSHKIKYSGDLVVKSKGKKRNERTIFFDSRQLKQLRLLSGTAFDKINEGDTISIEVSKYCRNVFSLKKGDESLLDHA